MQMGMMEQHLSPGVKHGKEAELGAEVLGVGRDGAQGLGRGAEQDAVDDWLVLAGDVGDLFRHGKDHVEIGRGQQFGSAVFEPLGAGQRLALRAMAIAAGVVPDALVAAGVTLFDVPAKRRRPAPHDRGHDTALRSRQRSAVLLTIGIAEAAEYLRHFRHRAAHRSGANEAGAKRAPA